MKRLLAHLAGLGWLYDGSLIVWQRRTDGLAGWVRRGRRPDLPGWRGALGPLARLVFLGGLALLVWAIVRAIPWLMWLLTGWWIRAARKASKTARLAAEGPSKPPAGHPPDDVRAATLEWIWRLVGDTQGVHLRDLLTHAHAHGLLTDVDLPAFRGHLERWGIPVRKRVRVRGRGVTVGIHRDDLQPPPTASPEEQAQESPEPRLHVL